ncbi:MAG: undecaprenyldiphospho-muramoylpentapeptide beta-N-acetylglucosaminyltransferase [Candidatus Sericytochromatia bacterium]|nr:undecaprenyldiphospho-muramoylpentapeptide beta-N-acetylglucosaminyltransferase [Candidatus Sericytochromatia bacterium]
MTGVALTGGGTGGHLYPLIAVADALRGLAPDLPITFVGSDSRLEATAVPAAGYPFVALPVVTVPRKPGLPMLHALGKLVQSFRLARTWLLTARPDVVIGAGGYISVPLVLAAATAGVPIVLLEQNADAGLATRGLARLATRVCVSFPETAEHLPRAVWTGNPLRNGFGRRERQPEQFGLDPQRPTLLIMGGSLGARRINAVATALAGKLLAETDWQVVHLSGEGGYADARAALVQHGVTSDRYQLLPYGTDMPGLLAATDLAIARAGATSVAELAVAGVPTIYIPYPGAGRHQEANARAAVTAGAARLLDEDGLDEHTLWAEISPLLRDQETRLAMASACATIAVPGAASTIAQQILTMLPARHHPSQSHPAAGTPQEGTSV